MSAREWHCQNPACDEHGEQTAPGRMRKFCSERCRKRQYDKACVDCGGRVDGTTPSRMTDAPRCRPCRLRYQHESRMWTPERVIAAIQAASDGDVAPSARDHHSSGLATIAQREFGSWAAAVAAAGFKPRAQGERSDLEAWKRARWPYLEQSREEFVRMWLAGTAIEEIAAARGSTRSAVYVYAGRLRKAGVDLPRRSPGGRATSRNVAAAVRLVESRGVTQTEAARRFGVSQAAVSRARRRQNAVAA